MPHAYVNDGYRKIHDPLMYNTKVQDIGESSLVTMLK